MADSNLDGQKEGKKDNCLLVIPGKQECKQRSLLLKHGTRDLTEDRLAARELYNNKETYRSNNATAYYRLPSIAEKLRSSPYRKSVNNNFTAHFYKWDEEYVFKYKTFSRGDKIHCADAFLDQMKCVKRKEFLKAVENKSVVDWISAVPLHVKYYSNRRSLIRTDFSLGRQPLNILCEPLLLHRVEFAQNFRGDRFLSPMMVVLNWNDIRWSIENRLLWIQSQVRGKLERQIETFVKENHHYWNARKKKSRPIVLPLAYVDPFSFWNRKRSGKKPGEKCDAKKEVCHFALGPLRPHRVFNELNQFPADFPSHFGVVRAMKDTRMTMTKFSPVKHRKHEEIGVWVRESYPNVVVEKSELLDEEGTDVPHNWLTIEPSIYEYGPDPVVTFRRDQVNGSLVAQTLISEEYDNESLASMSGWSTDSFASTMSETPGDYHFAWKSRQKLGMNASCRILEASDQNINHWRALSDKERTVQQIRESQERLAMASKPESSKLCRHSKNEYFMSILRQDMAEKFVYFDYDLMHRNQRLEELTDIVNDRVSKEEASILWSTIQRLLHYYPIREFDLYRGLDINHSWTNVIVQRLLPEAVICRLKDLFGSHDAWNDVTAADPSACIPLMHAHRILDEEKRPYAESFVFDVIMFICLIISFIFLMIVAPF